jgi:hypothetical protein
MTWDAVLAAHTAAALVSNYCQTAIGFLSACRHRIGVVWANRGRTGGQFH